MRNLFLVCILFSTIAACKKREAEPPVVSLSYPTEADTVFLLDSMNVECTISDVNLTSYKIIIYNSYTRKLFYEEEGYATSGIFLIDKKVYFEVNTDTTAYINVLGIDKNGNTGSAGTKFYISKK